MRRKRIVHFGLLSVLLAVPALAHGQDGRPRDAESYKIEIMDLRRELSVQAERMRDLQRELDATRATVVRAQIEAEAAERRCRELRNELALQRTSKAADRPPVEIQPAAEPSAPAKPARAPARGKITAVGRDGLLVQVSIGVDSGVKEGQALEVYRIATAGGKDRSVYLGVITLTRVDPQVALGDFKSVSGINYRPHVGDDVSAELKAK